MKRLLYLAACLAVLGAVLVAAVPAPVALPVSDFPAMTLNPTSELKAERRCWGSVTVDAPGTYRVLVEFPDKTLREVARVAFAPETKRLGVLRVRAYADDMAVPEPAPIEIERVTP